MNKIVYPITAVVCSLVLGVSFYAVQGLPASKLASCIEDADEAYQDFLKVNMTKRADGTWWGARWKWDAANKNKKDYETKCFKQFK